MASAYVTVSPVNSNDSTGVPISASSTPPLPHGVATSTPPVEPWGTDAPMLPPCCVCGERASGFHYGANTCEACKTFFRRTLISTRKYICRLSSSCEITPGRRHCSACRLAKCYRLGMAKSAVKTGRYTLEKKNNDIEAVKKLELQSRMNDDGTIRLISEREKELERVVNGFTNIFIAQNMCQPKFIEESLKWEAEFLEKRALEEQMFGSMKRLDREEYSRVFKSTGIDVDGRREFLSRMLPSIENSLKVFINFAKAVPGFSSLPLNDQIALMKASCMECWLILFACQYNTDEGVVIHPTGHNLVYTKEEIRCFSDRIDDQQRQWNLASKIQRLELTDEEKSTSAAICLMNADAELSRVGHVTASASAEYLVEALQMLCERNHDPEDHTMSKMLALMAEIRSLADYYKNIHLHMQEYSLKDGVPTLCQEIFHYAHLTRAGRRTATSSVHYLAEALEYLCDKNHDPQDQTLPKLIEMMADIRSLDSYNRKLNRDIVSSYADLGWSKICQDFLK